jgi:hypothetical protein
MTSSGSTRMASGNPGKLHLDPVPDDKRFAVLTALDKVVADKAGSRDLLINFPIFL